MRITLCSRHRELSFAGALAVSAILFAPLCAHAADKAAAKAPASSKSSGKHWVMPRTLDGKPDLQGNWTNETQTPFERMGNQGPTLTDAEAAALEKRAADVEEFRDRPTDPNAKATGPVGNELADVAGKPTFVERIAQAAGGNVGGYNGFWLDPGNRVVRVNGVAHSSILIDPVDGHIPPMTAEGKQRIAESMSHRKQFGEYDGPEARSYSDRCITSFGSNAGPPMLPNYFYNNNYTIVQSQDAVVILTEMVHDARIIKLGTTKHAPAQIRPWFGDSIGHWEGDTLVVETTNINPKQLQGGGLGAFRGASENVKVIERFTRTGPDVLLYKFTIEDPSTFTAPYGGELPFNSVKENVYEYACHEGNYALPAMLAGARAEERAKAEKTKQ